MAPRPLALERAARRDLRALRENSDSALARSYLLLARQLDMGIMTFRDEAAVIREMRLIFMTLHQMSGSAEEGDYTDELKARREARMIIDYSVARPSVAVLRALGVTAVGRYIGWDGQPGYQNIGKNLSLAEKNILNAAGISVFLNFEYAANAAAGGASQGTKDGNLASHQVAGLGIVNASDPAAVYYAYDFDVPDHAPQLPDTPANASAKLGPLGDYARAIHATKPNHEVAGYGGYWAVSRLLDAGLVRKAFQTLAWSLTSATAALPSPNAIRLQVNGQYYLYDKRAALRQELAQILGGDIDTFTGLHTGHGDDFGQWPRLLVPPKPPCYWHTATGAESLAAFMKARNGQVTVAVSLTERYGNGPQVAAFEKYLLGYNDVMPKGLQFATVNP
jgi:hypothetical protein